MARKHKPVALRIHLHNKEGEQTANKRVTSIRLLISRSVVMSEFNQKPHNPH